MAFCINEEADEEETMENLVAEGDKRKKKLHRLEEIDWQLKYLEYTIINL